METAGGLDLAPDKPLPSMGSGCRQVMHGQLVQDTCAEITNKYLEQHALSSRSVPGLSITWDSIPRKKPGHVVTTASPTEGHQNTANPRIRCFAQHCFVITLMRCRRNLILVHISEPRVKLFPLNVVSLKVVGLAMTLSEDLLY